MNQTHLFGLPAKSPFDRALEIIRDRPLEFCHLTEGKLLDNRDAWEAFYEATERLRRAGRDFYGAKAVWEHLRYQSAVQDDDIVFKLNNNLVSGFARMYNAVSGIDFFETRRAA